MPLKLLYRVSTLNVFLTFVKIIIYLHFSLNHFIHSLICYFTGAVFAVSHTAGAAGGLAANYVITEGLHGSVSRRDIFYASLISTLFYTYVYFKVCFLVFIIY